MRPVSASLVAMVVAWALPLLGVAVGQLMKSGRTADLGVMAFWSGLFSLLAWTVAVLPAITRFAGRKLVSNLHWSWLGWCIYALVVFSILTTPILGKAAFIVLWYPALMGCMAGVVFALTVRIPEAKND